MPDTLILIDIQRDYFPGGRFPLVGPEAAAERAAALLGAFRDRGLPVIHVRHESLEADAGFLAAGTEGAQLHPAVAPAGDEIVVVKHHPNAFLETDLEGHLAAGSSLVVAGMMTSMCVDATVRAASDLGYSVTVAGDACAALISNTRARAWPARTSTRRSSPRSAAPTRRYVRSTSSSAPPERRRPRARRGGTGDDGSDQASALAFRASNSACVMAPESSSFLADSISEVGEVPATSRMYALACS